MNVTENDITSLRGRTQFERVSRKGSRFGRGFIQLRILSNSLMFTRLGIVIPIKAVRSAVDRNRIRRLIRESFRALPYAIKPGLDIVVMVRQAPSEDKMCFVQKEIIKLLEKSGSLLRTI